jgi:hypothetical protein
MADHQATWVGLREAARERFPDDDLAAEIDAEETVVYAADLDAQVETHGVLDTARAAARLWDELRNELRVKGSGAGGNRNREEYGHLDDDLDADDLAYLELPIDGKAAEAVADQRALMASFETQYRDESALASCDGREEGGGG